MCTRRILGLAVVALLTLGGRARAYTNQWAAHIDGGEEVARQVAEVYGFRYLGKVSAARARFSPARVRPGSGCLFIPYIIFPIIEIARFFCACERKKEISRTTETRLRC